MLTTSASTPPLNGYLEIIGNRGDPVFPAENGYVRYGAVRSCLEIVSRRHSDAVGLVTDLAEAIRDGFHWKEVDPNDRMRIVQQLKEQTTLNPAHEGAPPVHWAFSMKPLAVLAQEMEMS